MCNRKKIQGIKYSCGGKVSVKKDGSTTTGYIVDEYNNKLCVHLVTGRRIMVNKVPLENLIYKYKTCGASNKWCVTHYWPLIIKISAGCVMNMQLLLSRIAFRNTTVINQLSS